jgi:hypothetical protein
MMTNDEELDFLRRKNKELIAECYEIRKRAHDVVRVLAPLQGSSPILQSELNDLFRKVFHTLFPKEDGGPAPLV